MGPLRERDPATRVQLGTAAAVVLALATSAPASPQVASARATGAHVEAGERAQVGRVFVVAAAGGGDFAALQPAIDQAQDGDVLLVKGGTYPAFVLDGKALAIVEEPGEVAVVAGPSRVVGLPAGRLAVVAGINVVAGAPGAGPALEVADCAGAVRLQRAAFFGSPPAAGMPGGTAVSIARCDDLALIACEAFGGEDPGTPGSGPGGNGGLAVDSTIVLWGATCEGGEGASSVAAAACGFAGGVGFEQVNGVSFDAASYFRGGAGGPSDDCAFGCGGDGGLPFAVRSQPIQNPPPLLARFLDDVFEGGAGGDHPCGSPGTTAMSAPFASGATTAMLPGTKRLLLSPTPVRDATTTSLTFRGEPGDQVFLLGSRDSAHAWTPALGGVVLVGAPFTLQLDLGVLPASGVLTWPMPIPDAWAPAGGASILHIQPVFVAASGELHLGNPSTLVVIDHAN